MSKSRFTHVNDYDSCINDSFNVNTTNHIVVGKHNLQHWFKKSFSLCNSDCFVDISTEYQFELESFPYKCELHPTNVPVYLLVSLEHNKAVECSSRPFNMTHKSSKYTSHLVGYIFGKCDDQLLSIISEVNDHLTCNYYHDSESPGRNRYITATLKKELTKEK